MARKQKKSKTVSKIPPAKFRVVSTWMQVMKVHDGSTIEGVLTLRRWWFWKAEEDVAVRPAGIVCPELHIYEAGQEPDEFAIETLQYVKQRIEGKWVKTIIAQKRTGELVRENHGEWAEPRLLAFIHPTFFGIKRMSLNERLVRKGWARRYAKSEWMTKEYHRKLLRAERLAKRRRAGLWSSYETETELESRNFWTGFILGLLLGIIIGFLLFLYRTGTW